VSLVAVTRSREAEAIRIMGMIDPAEFINDLSSPVIPYDATPSSFCVSFGHAFQTII